MQKLTCEVRVLTCIYQVRTAQFRRDGLGSRQPMPKRRRNMYAVAFRTCPKGQKIVPKNRESLGTLRCEKLISPFEIISLRNKNAVL